MKTMAVLLLIFLSPVTLAAQSGKVRVYVTDSQSWEITGGFGGRSDSMAGATRGGSRPQTAEIIKTFNEKCPEMTVTINKEKANYIVLLDKEGGKGVIRKDVKIAVFDGEGDAVYSGSTATVGNAIKDACGAIRKTEQGEPR